MSPFSQFSLNYNYSSFFSQMISSPFPPSPRIRARWPILYQNTQGNKITDKMKYKIFLRGLTGTRERDEIEKGERGVWFAVLSNVPRCRRCREGFKVLEAPRSFFLNQLKSKTRVRFFVLSDRLGGLHVALFKTGPNCRRQGERGGDAEPFVCVRLFVYLCAVPPPPRHVRSTQATKKRRRKDWIGMRWGLLGVSVGSVRDRRPYEYE
jgi:hypothetical protein